MAYIAIIGGGSWGVALSVMLAEKDYDVSLWVHKDIIIRQIQQHRRPPLYFPEVKFSENIKLTSSLSEALSKARYVICAIPTQFVRSVFKEVALYIEKDAIVVSASKGIEKGSLLTVSGILKELLINDVAVLSGPSFAKEVAQKLPTAVTIATTNTSIALLLQEVFSTDYFRVYTHHDILGVELGGALKNVIAIATGVSDGLGLGLNARAALITRGLAEIIRLGVKMGAEEKTFSGLSGVGDLVLTCTAPMSRNYTVGYNLGKGKKLKDILSNMKEIAEGIETSYSVYELSKKYKIDMPIVEQVYQILYKDKNPSLAVKELMGRTLKEEFYQESN